MELGNVTWSSRQPWIWGRVVAYQPFDAYDCCTFSGQLFRSVVRPRAPRFALSTCLGEVGPGELSRNNLVADKG